MRIRGLASSGRMPTIDTAPMASAPMARSATALRRAADLSFRCDVDYRGYVRDVDINRRY